MKNFDNIKDLWGQSGSEKDLPAVKEMISRIEAERKKMLRKNLFLIAILCGTFAFICWVGFHYDFEMITTRIGIVITLVAIVLGIIFNSRLVNMLAKKSDATLNNNAFLQQLIEFRTRQRFMQAKGLSAYFILLTLGIMIYMYEFASRDLTFGIIVYSVTLAWIAFNWFYVRKKTIAKQEKQINGQISSIEKLMNNINKSQENETL